MSKTTETTRDTFVQDMTRRVPQVDDDDTISSTKVFEFIVRN